MSVFPDLPFLATHSHSPLRSPTLSPFSLHHPSTELGDLLQYLLLHSVSEPKSGSPDARLEHSDEHQDILVSPLSTSSPHEITPTTMSIVMPNLHTLPSYDPFNPHPTYPTSLFSPQDHYQHATAPLTSYAHPPTYQMHQSWLGTSFSGHASAAPHQLTNHPDIIPSQQELLSLSPSSTFAPHSPIPALSGSRNRPRPLSHRFRSLNNTSTTMQRQSTASSRGTHRLTRRSNAQSPPQQSAGRSPTGISPPYMTEPALESPQDGQNSRAVKRRRINEEDMPRLQPYTAASEPLHVMTPSHQPQQPQIHGHGFGASQTWAGPPTAGHLGSGPAATSPHGLNQTPTGFPHWPVGLHYYPAEPNQHLLHDPHSTPTDASHPSMRPFPSPTVAGTTYFVAPASPVSTPPSVGSGRSQVKKVEPDSPTLEVDSGIEHFEHPPTEFPPRPYPGGSSAKSPWAPVKQVGKIFGSRLEQMPAIERRLAKLEDHLDKYLDVRAEQALKNSQLPGLAFDPPPIQAKAKGPSRIFGGRIWPTALARRVRRTPRD